MTAKKNFDRMDELNKAISHEGFGNMNEKIINNSTNMNENIIVMNNNILKLLKIQKEILDEVKKDKL
ncbi:MAG: hypothetical protein LBT10_02260 [Methanobrevibacter sp.]|jgi:hypothetical protein|nr:hypothetical protein [Methanobrevibacter sp.]